MGRDDGPIQANRLQFQSEPTDFSGARQPLGFAPYKQGALQVQKRRRAWTHVVPRRADKRVVASNDTDVDVDNHLLKERSHSRKNFTDLTENSRAARYSIGARARANLEVGVKTLGTASKGYDKIQFHDSSRKASSPIYRGFKELHKPVSPRQYDQKLNSYNRSSSALMPSSEGRGSINIADLYKNKKFKHGIPSPANCAEFRTPGFRPVDEEATVSWTSNNRSPAQQSIKSEHSYPTGFTAVRKSPPLTPSRTDSRPTVNNNGVSSRIQAFSGTSTAVISSRGNMTGSSHVRAMDPAKNSISHPRAPYYTGVPVSHSTQSSRPPSKTTSVSSVPLASTSTKPQGPLKSGVVLVASPIPGNQSAWAFHKSVPATNARAVPIPAQANVQAYTGTLIANPCVPNSLYPNSNVVTSYPTQPQPHVKSRESVTNKAHRKNKVGYSVSKTAPVKKKRRKKYERVLKQEDLEDLDALRWQLKNAYAQHKLTCHICHKVLSSVSSRNKHILAHSRRLNFECGLCGLKFLQEHILKKHQSKKHPEMVFAFNSEYA